MKDIILKDNGGGKQLTIYSLNFSLNVSSSKGSIYVFKLCG